MRRANDRGVGPPQNWTSRSIEEIEKLERKNRLLKGAIEWMLGIKDEFPIWKYGDGRYWWRKVLRERAGFDCYLYDKETQTVRLKKKK